MAARTGQHEQMPNEMTVAQALVDEKEHTSGIGDATGYQPEQCRNGIANIIGRTAISASHPVPR